VIRDPRCAAASTNPDALPAISYICVCTFFGIDEAVRVSALPAFPV
jgi:hypothetical protein